MKKWLVQGLKMLRRVKHRFKATKRLKVLKKKGIVLLPVRRIPLKMLGADEKLFLSMLVFCGMWIVGALGIGMHLHYQGTVSHVVLDEDSFDETAAVDSSSSSALIYSGKRLPDEVTRRQDQMPESDNLLMDLSAEASRGVASLLSKDLKVDLGSRIVDIGDFLSSSLPSEKSASSVLFASVSFEVKTAEVEREILDREVELQSVILGIIGEKTREELGTHQGIVEVKREVKRQVNNVLAKGKVEDVYFRDFVFK